MSRKTFPRMLGQYLNGATLPLIRLLKATDDRVS